MTEKQRIGDVLTGIAADQAHGLLTDEKASWLIKKLEKYEAGKLLLEELNDYFHVPF